VSHSLIFFLLIEDSGNFSNQCTNSSHELPISSDSSAPLLRLRPPAAESWILGPRFHGSWPWFREIHCGFVVARLAVRAERFFMCFSLIGLPFLGAGLGFE
jgi:hypothetical protein